MMSNGFTFKGITFMTFLKHYAYAPFVLLLHSFTVSASQDFAYPADNKENFASQELKSTLPWEKTEPQIDKQLYCLTPSEPGCSNMWQKEKEKENDERVLRYQQKKLYSSLKWLLKNSICTSHSEIVLIVGNVLCSWISVTWSWAIVFAV